MVSNNYRLFSICDVYEIYNRCLFQNRLPKCQVIFVNSRSQYVKPDTEYVIKDYKHKIKLNKETFIHDDKLGHADLIHQMIHLWQEVEGQSSIDLSHGFELYHNKEWLSKAKEIGFIPFESKGGRGINSFCSKSIVPNGKFETLYNIATFEPIKIKELNVNIEKPIKVRGFP